MAGSLFADEYLYIDDFEVAQNQLGKNITVNVKAHFDDAVSAIQGAFELPEGMTLRAISKGSAITGLTYITEWGEEAEVEGLVFTPNVPNCNFAVAIAEKGYYEVDGEYVTYGSVKWLSGEYDQMVKLTINVAADFAGGTIIVKTAPSCSADSRPDVTPCTPHSMQTDPYVKECVVTVEKPADPLAVTLDPAEASATTGEKIAVTVEANKEDATFNYACEGATVTPTETGFEITATEAGTYKVTVTATVGEETANAEGTYTFTAPTYAPEPKITMSEDYVVTAAVEGDDSYTVKLYINGEEVENPYTIEQTDEAQTITFTAITQKKDEDYNSAEVEETFTVPAKEPEVPGETKTFVKVTSMDQIVDGKNYIFVYEAAPFAMANMNGASAAVTLAEGEVTADMSKVMEFALTINATSWSTSYTFTNNGTLLGGARISGSGSSAVWGPTAGGSNTAWTITNVNGAVDGYTVRNTEAERYMKVATYDNTFILSTSSTAPYAVLYVEKTDEPEKPEFEGTASVVFNENVATLTYTSNDPDATVVVKVDGTEKTVEWTKNEETGEYTATYTVEKSDVTGEHSVTVALTVTPSDNYTGEEVSNSATYTYTILEKTEKPVITYENGENGVVVTATGNGTIILYVEDQQVATGEGTATYTIPYGTDPEEVGVSATAQESGKDVSDYALKDVVVPGVFTATASVEFNDNVATLTYTTNDEDATVTVKVDDVETTVEWNNGQATYTVEKSTTPGEYSVTVELTVAPSDLFYGEPVEASDLHR